MTMNQPMTASLSATSLYRALARPDDRGVGGKCAGLFTLLGLSAALLAVSAPVSGAGTVRIICSPPPPVMQVTTIPEQPLTEGGRCQGINFTADGIVLNNDGRNIAPEHHKSIYQQRSHGNHEWG